MTLSSRWVTGFFQIRAGEIRMAVLAILAMLLPALGGGIGSPVIEALFFTRFGVEFLPSMYVALGLITFLVTMVLTALLGRVPRAGLFQILPAAMAVSLLLARISVGLELHWIYPLLWLWMYVMWSLQGLFGWGLAGLVCDTRQAKRLFPLFGAGAILGNALGGLLTQPLVGVLGTENPLLIWGGLLLVTAWISRSLAHSFAKKSAKRPIRRPAILRDLQVGYRFVRSSSLMRWMSLAAFLFSVLAFSLSFPFAQGVADQFPREANLAGFLGAFQGVTTGVAFAVSLFLANRLFRRIGFMGAILAFPALYLMGFSTLIALPIFATLVAFRFFQLAWMEGVASTAYQALFNLVPAGKREQTRAFVDGVPGQAGVVAIGLTFLLGQSLLDPRHFYLMGVGAAGLTLFALWKARHAFRGALAQALRSGQSSLFFAEASPFAGLRQDRAAVHTALEGLGDPDPTVRRTSAEILGKLQVSEVTPAMIRALEDPNPRVRAAVLDSLAQTGSAESLLEVAVTLKDPDPQVRLQAVRAVDELAPYPRGVRRHLEPVLNDPDPEVRSQAAICLLTTASESRAVATLREMVQEGNPEERALALHGLAKWGDGSAYQIAEALLQDDHPAVRAAALEALANVDRERAIPALLSALADPDPTARQAAAEQLGKAGLAALEPVLGALDDPEREAGAVYALGHLPAHRAAARLQGYVKAKVHRSLHYYRILQSIPSAPPDVSRTLTRDSLQLAARHHGTLALKGLNLLNREPAVSLAINNLESAEPEQRANALEILDSLPQRESIRPLLPLWEGEKAAELEGAGDGIDRHQVEQLLEDSDSWLRACAVQLSLEHPELNLKGRLQQLAKEDPDPFLRETAWAALNGGNMTDPASTLTTMERILFLRRVPLFEDLPPDELKQVASIAQERLFEDGELLVKQGTTGEEMFIIVSGEVTVLLETEEGVQEIARRGSGEYVGEMAIISQEPRMATLQAEGDVRALCLDQERFEQILRHRPEASLAVIRTLIARLKEDQETVQS